MLKGPDAHSDRFLQDLAAINQRANKAQREITSGRRINAPSDAPDEISQLLLLRSSLSTATQSKSNLGRVQAEVDTAEQALAHGIEVLDRIQVLGAQGANGTIDAAVRRTISDEIEGLLGQLVNVANTEIDGRFVFSGDTDQTAPYSFDPSLNDAVSTYAGAATTRQIAHPSGSRFGIAKTADAVFQASGAENDIFGSVSALRNALRDNDVPGIAAAVANVRSAAKHLNRQQAFYGGVQNQVAEATDYADKQILLFKQRISSVEDADITAAILDLNSATQTREAAFAAEAKRPRTTLFDYLR